MRINPIRETNYPNYNSFQTKKLTHKSANSASITDLSILNQNYNQVRINFRGVPNTSLELIKQIPLEDRACLALSKLQAWRFNPCRQEFTGLR